MPETPPSTRGVRAIPLRRPMSRLPSLTVQAGFAHPPGRQSRITPLPGLVAKLSSMSGYRGVKCHVDGTEMEKCKKNSGFFRLILVNCALYMRIDGWNSCAVCGSRDEV